MDLNFLKYNLPLPDVTGRKMVHYSFLDRGDVVAFKTNDHRTGIIVMEFKDMMMVAVNLYGEKQQLWYSDPLPEDIELYEPSEEERIWGYQFFLEYESTINSTYYNKNHFITFIDNECYEDDNGYQKRFCFDFLSRAHKMLDNQQREVLKKELGEVIMQSRGLQFNRLRMENYCFLMGILMIAEKHSGGDDIDVRIDKYRKNWRHFSWMYGMVIGQVVGSRLHNFTAVVNQTGQNSRDSYLHLYLPLVENNIDTICLYNDDDRGKLVKAIEKMRTKESQVEQSTDLDYIYGLLFPKYFKEAMSSQRPAATIAELRKEIAVKDQKINELESSIKNLKNQYDDVVSKLTDAVSAVENDLITPNDLKTAFLRFDSTMAHTLFGSVATVLTNNSTWQKYAPQIQQAIIDKQEMEKNRDKIKQEIVLYKHVEREVNNVENGGIGFQTNN